MVRFSSLFQRGGLSLERLRALVEIDEAGSLIEAAERSTSKASQLSRQLSELEEFFRRALKQKQGRNVVLSADGRRLAEEARWALAALEGMVAERATPSALRLAAGDSVLHWLVLPRIGGLPGRFSVVGLPAEQVVARLREGSVDLGLVRRDEIGAPLRSRPLGVLEHALFLPRGLGRGDDEDLPFEVPLAMQTSDPEFVEALERLAKRRGKSLNVALECETFPQVFRAVQSGLYAGVLPTLAARELPRARSVAIGKLGFRLHLAWDARWERVRPDARELTGRLADALRMEAQLPQR